jgi:MFS transporter, DHA1 family, tetracycline resistance protein
MKNEKKLKKSPLFIIFTTVLIDLIGFGMVIPLIGLYGRHYGASTLELSVLGGIYSLMQFFFSPFWGALSDRIGRRPVLLISLGGSTLSYIIFGLAPNYTWLLLARAVGGIFAANISTAQAYIADVTPPQDRAKGMGLIGAAFGIGFTLGPPLGGIASAQLGLAAPGLLAALICGSNLLLAVFRLPESFPKEQRALAQQTNSSQTRSFSPIDLKRLTQTFQKPQLALLMTTFFSVTFAFSMMEQTFSLLFQSKFSLDTGEAGLKTGLVLMVSGILGAIVQGGLIRKLAPRFGERKLLLAGIFINIFAMGLFPFSPNFAFYFLLAIPIALGSSLVNPSLSALISKNASTHEQGSTLGISQGLGSLARATGPFLGLLSFGVSPELPYLFASGISFILFLLCFRGVQLSQPQTHATAEPMINST